MNVSLLKGMFIFVLLLLAQVLVLNHVHLFGFATPLPYVYMVLLFRRGYPKWAILLLCFLMGLGIDVFSDTPGVTMASMTFLGLLQPYLLSMFIQRDVDDTLAPSFSTLGTAKFVYYTIISVTIYCFVFFTLEAFNFFNWQLWLATIGGSIVLTVILVLVLENLRKK
ncbi:rod shape-determining protein MreD [Prevotella sp. DNF00663]|uniref:rod shape-determining protein MreD n=1 Tax=unclassified Prevotella TaxID=2638335 RepID=UPI0005143122|nr:MULTISPECIES: rod shape-determining protein MreD [unclassified Prevotella]KGI60280.1 rod shape-determining protein MreD [Prevotella sp. S7 MS 2]KXB82797.1 rod shape-determining protein MreD [Prevotella sp. DNF00663]